MEGTTHKLIVPEGEVGRLDAFVAAQLALSRTRAQKLVASGMVLLDGRAAKKSEPVSSGAVVEVRVPAAESVEIEAEDLPLDIVYQDDDIVVVNKNDLPSLLRNDTKSGHHWLALRLVGSTSNCDGIGARVRVVTGGRVQTREVRAGASYLSHNSLWLSFGLGESAGVFVCPEDAGDFAGAVGLRYAWREWFEVDTDSASLSGSQLASVQASDLVLAFDDLPNRHARGGLNAAALDTSSRFYPLNEFEMNLARAVR